MSQISNQTFQQGQRWVSHAEIELGLGTVEKIEGRQVDIFFPAAEQSRVYAFNNAPLSRVIYSPGDEIRTIEGVSLIVDKVQEHNGCVIYLCHDEQQQDIVLHEVDLDSISFFNKPQDRLFIGQIDKNKLFDLRLKTLDFQHKLDTSPFAGLTGPRVQLLPHQFYIANQVTQRRSPRVLLADEVGLGKTIEAGLILHQQLLSGAIERVIIVVPDALIHQWLVELLRRFNLSFTILDQDRCEAIRDEGDINPFETAQLVLCQLSFLSDNANYHAMAVSAGWDLMIVDEAHHLYWDEEKVSAEYKCVETLANQVPGLLLLTATPEQLGVTSHFARLRLLDPDRYFDLAAFNEEQKGYQYINDLIKEILEIDSVKMLLADNVLKKSLIDKLGEEFLLAEDLSTEKVIEALLDRHGIGRVLFRNTRDTVDGFSTRELHSYLLPVLNVEQIAIEPVVLADSLLPEKILGQQWLELDPRIDWLVDWLEIHKTEKVLLICAQQQTAEELHNYINLRTNFRSAVFHEGMSLIARDRAAAYFADSDDGAQILICSEIGSEGRNFQFSHHLVLFDLPLNPDLLEQRIGRLDRIGQTETVHIHVPCIEQSAQHLLMQWYDEGLNAFRQVCPVGHHVYANVKIELKEALIKGVNDADFTDIINNTHTLTQHSLQELHQGRDLMLELNSCRKEPADELIANISLSSSKLELSQYMELVFENLGVDQQYHSEDTIVLKPSSSMQQDYFTGLDEEGLTATYNRKTALSREDFQFLTWEHPMVTSAMEQIISSEFGNATFCTMSLPPVTSGTVIVEAIYKQYCPAPKRLQLHRYLAQTVQRIVVASNGLDMTNILKPEHISNRIKFVKRAVAQNIIKHATETIKSLITRSEELVKPFEDTLIEQTLALMHQQEDDKLQRLVALAKVNPNIRELEITQQQDHQVQMEEHIKKASLKLDAVRVILITD